MLTMQLVEPIWKLVDAESRYVIAGDVWAHFIAVSEGEFSGRRKVPAILAFATRHRNVGILVHTRKSRLDWGHIN